MPTPSPCVNICKIDPDSDFCAGCLRTREEIRAWGRSDDRDRRAILARVVARRQNGE